jgi:hypothetical protein
MIERNLETSNDLQLNFNIDWLFMSTNGPTQYILASTTEEIYLAKYSVTTDFLTL